jgi:hypothetical protein
LKKIFALSEQISSVHQHVSRGLFTLGTPWFRGFGGFTKNRKKSSKIPLFSKNPKNPKTGPSKNVKKRKKERRRRLLIGRKIGNFLTHFGAIQGRKFF